MTRQQLQVGNAARRRVFAAQKQAEARSTEITVETIATYCREAILAMRAIVSVRGEVVR